MLLNQYLLNLLVPFLTLAISSAYGAETNIPAGEANCTLQQPPESAGAYVTPGGFLLVYPRNNQLTPDYTGCKSIWVVDSFDRAPPLLMTIYFEQGQLRIIKAYDGRSSNVLRATCVLPSSTKACQEAAQNPLTSLKLSTWPRTCMTQPELAVCQKEPE